MQKHAARRLHYDFRLELDGVLLSWAIPKGPSLDPSVKRLAMQTEDHPLEYGGFEGVIPRGEYGGGTVLLWDRGTWRPEGDAREMYRRGRLTFELEGEKLRGGFHLVRAAGSRGASDQRRWLLIKRSDNTARPGSDAAVVDEQPYSVASGRDLPDVARDADHVWSSKPRGESRRGNGGASVRAPDAAVREKVEDMPGVVRGRLPDFVEPELATLARDAPRGDDWIHEIKLDGYRILARIDRGNVRLLSRRGIDWTSRMPSIASALGGLGCEGALLDGEVVVLREDGVSDFQRLQNSLDADRDADCIYFVFDMPHLGGFDLRPVPLLRRKQLLRELLVTSRSDRLRFADHVSGAGHAVFERACRLGLEGIVSKRADAAYTSGRGRAWLKIKCLQRQEFVIGGFTEPAGSRGHLGALLLGVREGEALVYAGKVGTGFTAESLAELAQRLGPLERSDPPFVNPPRGTARRGVHWVDPLLVAEVAFIERTQDGLIRHASFQGLREDESPREVRFESAVPVARTRATGRAARKAPAQHGSARTSPEPAATGARKAQGASRRTPGTTASEIEPSRTRKDERRRTPPRRVATPHSRELPLSRLEVTNPDRVLYPDRGLTKRDLLLYYARVARWMLPHVIQRPLMLVRCPEGAEQQCFHQKHPSRGMPGAVAQVLVPEKRGEQPNLMIRDAEGLLGLVQMGALEIHTWGCRAEALDAPDQLVFDLDPDEALPWSSVVRAAARLRSVLECHGLSSFLKTTGGKGLHLVVPVIPETPWDAAKAFTKRVADALVQAEPERYLATMTKNKRRGKVFIDYFRNGAGATSVAVFSTRARPGAPVSMPVGWDELEADLRYARFNVSNIDARLAALRRDPWEGFEAARAPIPRR